MKRRTVMTLLLAGSLAAQATDYQYLTIEKNDGTALSLTAVGLNITYTGTQLTATNGYETTTFSLSEISRMYFSNTKETTGIETTVAEIAKDAEVYDLNGRRVLASNLQKGVYIVKENGKTRKVTIK